MYLIYSIQMTLQNALHRERPIIIELRAAYDSKEMQTAILIRDTSGNNKLKHVLLS